MSEITRKLAIFGCLLFTSFCFWKVGTGLIRDTDTEILPSAHAAMSPSLSPPRVVTTPIQEMRPGMRIVGRNPLRIQTEPTIDPTPEGWRLVSVRMPKEDGTYFEAELLRPLSWLRQQRAQPGATIDLNMSEMYVVGAAEVLAVSACPPIDSGDGPVVISTFKNTADNVLNIYVEGETEPIGVTAGHPIWSEDRQAFVHTDQLQPGERLRSAVGKTVRITSIEIRAGPEPVYNLEVAGEHVYSVTDSGLLVHNSGPCYLVPRGQNVDLNSLYSTTDVLSSSHLVSQADTVGGVGLRAPARSVANRNLTRAEWQALHRQQRLQRPAHIGMGQGANQMVDRIAGEIDGAVSQAGRILDSGGHGGTYWGRRYQQALAGSDGMPLYLIEGNARQQIADRLLRNNHYVRESGVIMNHGHQLGLRNRRLNLFRPDYQIPLDDSARSFGIIDLTTKAAGPKIWNYYHSETGTPILYNIFWR